MKKMVCEICGSQRIQKQNGVFACQECGTEYSLDEAKKLLQEVEAINDLPLPNEKENESQSNGGEKLLAILYAWAKLIQAIPGDLELWIGKKAEDFWRESPSKSELLSNLHKPATEFCTDLFPKIVESDLLPSSFVIPDIPEKLKAIVDKTPFVKRTLIRCRAAKFWCNPYAIYVSSVGGKIETVEAKNLSEFLTSQIFYSTEMKNFFDWYEGYFKSDNWGGTAPRSHYLRPNFFDAVGYEQNDGPTWLFESEPISMFYFWGKYYPNTPYFYYKNHEPMTINAGTFFHPIYVKRYTPASDCKFDIRRLIEKSTECVKAFVKEHNERMDYYEQHYDEICSYLEEILDKGKILEKELSLSYDERNLESIMQMINLVKTGRVSSAKEMLNLFDTHQFREETLTEARFINEKLEAIEKQLKDNAYKIDELNSNLMSSIIGIDEIGLKMNAISSGLKKISRNTFITMWNTF